MTPQKYADGDINRSCKLAIVYDESTLSYVCIENFNL